MNGITQFLNHSNNLVVISAPPAWGKTSLILDLLADSNNLWLYISPLKAVSYEFYEKVRGKYKAFLLDSSLPDNLDDFDIIILTAEKTKHDFLYLLERVEKKVCVIADEIHLFFDWGKDFRPQLWFVLIELLKETHSALFLSATINQSHFEEINLFSKVHFEQSLYLDFGNMLLKNKPKTIYRETSGKRLVQFLKYSLYLKKTILVFVPYRKNVDDFKKKFEHMGYDVLGCKGGEVADFRLKLSENPSPHLIISTIALSHGVNLPALSAVFIFHKETNESMWIQMVGRGGRRGEQYILYSLCKSPRGWFANVLSIGRTKIHFYLCKGKYWKQKLKALF